MKSINITPQEFKPLFRGIFKEPPSYFNAEVFCQTSMVKSKVLLIQLEESWNTFIDKDGEALCSQEGIELFNSPEKYSAYISSFKKHLAEANEIVIPKYSSVPEEMSKEEFISLFNFLGKFWFLYGFTEFPYTNAAYLKATQENNSVMQENLDNIYAAKVEGRKVMNLFFFVDGVMPNIIRYFSRKYFDDEKSANYLSYTELLGLFDGKKPSIEKTDKRKKCLIVLSLQGKTSELLPEMASGFIEHLITLKERNSVSGTIANKGKATGKVVIAPMLNSPEEVKKVFDKMEDGAILVAQTTSPELMLLCHRAAAIVADQGGMLSHAAVVSRELGIPCIVGTNHGTVLFHDGDLVEVDAEKGVVRKIS